MKKSYIDSLVESLKHKKRKLHIYTYHFPDGKIYIGYTSRTLESRHQEHKRCSISSIYKRLNNEKTYTKPKYEETVTVDFASGELYKILRKILDKYNAKKEDILNPNLYLYGY